MTRITLLTAVAPIIMLIPPPGPPPGLAPTPECEGCPEIVVVEPSSHHSGHDCDHPNVLTES